ncbi:TPA: hypothetical protein ACH3X2_012463 [Trebouxia sp. C0005]
MERGLSAVSLGRRASRAMLNDEALSLRISGSPVHRRVSKPNLLDFNPSLATLAKKYAWDWLAILLLMVVLVITEELKPFEKSIYNETDQETWRYSYPLHTKNTVPAWAVPVLSTCGPASIFIAWYIIWRPSRWEMHNLILGLMASVFACALITNMIKITVGRPRPNFAERCWPGGQSHQYSSVGVPQCSSNSVDPAEGRKSFPSGHTSWSTSGLAYLSLWLAGKLHCFDGHGHPWKAIVSVMPTGLAVWIGITRLQDYWHHWEDVTVGFLLGVLCAFVSYRQHYPGIASQRAGEAFVISKGFTETVSASPQSDRSIWAASSSDSGLASLAVRLRTLPGSAEYSQDGEEIRQEDLGTAASERQDFLDSHV